VPGIGISYDAGSELQIFGGIHRGFAPPGPGSSDFTEPEESVNYEFGTRFDQGALAVDATVFFNDYSNLLGADTLSTGGDGSGNLFNGGDVDVIGLEAAARFTLAGAGPLGAIPMRLSYTYTNATFQHSFVSDYEPWGVVETGDKLPYLPEHQLSAGLGIERDRWAADLQATYNSAMRTEASQGPIDPRHATDAFLVWNLSMDVRVADQVVAFAAIENLTDNAYIVARRPAGARPGLPRTLVSGLRLDF
jgi:Fe(3+) dicitrate transport protein